MVKEFRPINPELYTVDLGQMERKQGAGTLDFGDGTSYTGKFLQGLAIEGFYDWGEGVLTNSFQDENGNWIDRE